MTETAVRFAGPVSCQRGDGAVKFTLSGMSAAVAGQQVSVGFTSAAPTGLPAALLDAVVEERAPGMFRISSPAGEWPLLAQAMHVHRDVTAAFYRAIPPRPVPLGKRIFWRLVLMLAASSTGMAVLRKLRGNS
jgi:hypothetical protein